MVGSGQADCQKASPRYSRSSQRLHWTAVNQKMMQSTAETVSYTHLLNDAHRAALEASVPEFEFRFNALDDVHAEDVLWADIVLGNAPVSMIRQNKHIEWFQSNSAGPDAYLKPGVLPENCMVTNATGAYGLAISEWMLAMWLDVYKRQPSGCSFPVPCLSSSNLMVISCPARAACIRAAIKNPQSAPAS